MSDESLKPMALEGVGEVVTPLRVAVLEYLYGLDSGAFEQLAAKWEMAGKVHFMPFTEWDAEECIKCLQLFLEYGVWAGYLFRRGDIWKHYLLSIVEDENCKVGLEYICTVGSPADLIIFLRATYKMGRSVIPDQEFDALESMYTAAFPNYKSILEGTSDDVAPYMNENIAQAIKFSSVRGARTVTPKQAPSTGAYAQLNAEKSTSVKPVRSAQEAYEFMLGAPKVRTHWSLKVDGVNTKCLFKDGEDLEIAVSRGRAADGWDYTEAIKRVIETQGIDVSGINGKVTGEAIVDSSVLEKFRLKYIGKDYKSPKSTAGAMLRAPQLFEVEDYKYLRYYPFDVEGMLKSDAFDALIAAGFVVPPSFTIDAGGVPLGSLEEFSEWLSVNIMDPLWNLGKDMDIGSDGVVLQLLTDVESDRADKYSDLNIALKFSHWTEAEYQSVVEDILFEQQRVEMSVVLVIEPVTTRDLNVATRVSVGSSAILIKDGVKVGDKIRFARKSEAINIYLGKVVE